MIGFLICFVLCRAWLKSAGLAVTPEQEAAPLLSNPLRNGVLLCTLAGEQPCSCQLLPLVRDTTAIAVLYGTAL